jgi:hypothetical protein
MLSFKIEKLKNIIMSKNLSAINWVYQCKLKFPLLQIIILSRVKQNSIDA